MALDTMGFIGETDVLREISVRLEESHLAYLQLDESPLKLQARKKLEGYIKEYLFHVPNERKYVFQDTADILYRSAATIKDFSGYRACAAWRALSLYAANLLAQPWRKEYRTLRTYSGYYKHEIETNLIGAELMFELMGYKHTGLGVLTLEGPIDPDRVSNVSRDAIVAYVECQILKDIWENVSQKFTISWLEVLEFRCCSVGNAEQAARALNFRFHERLNREKTSSSIFRDYSQYVQPLKMEVSYGTLVSGNIAQREIMKSCEAANLPNSCKNDITGLYPSDETFYLPRTDTSSMTNRFANPSIRGPMINHYYPLSHEQLGCSTKLKILPGHAARVPIGRLIELDTPSTLVNYETTTKMEQSRSFRDDIDKIVNNRSRDIENEPNVKRREKITRNIVIDDDSVDGNDINKDDNNDESKNYSTIEKSRSLKKLTRKSTDQRDNDWEFVYKNLESRGYSKDLGERDDVLLRKREMLLESKGTMRFPQKNQRSHVVKHDFRENTDIRDITRDDNNDDDKTRHGNVGTSGMINFNHHDNTIIANERDKRYRDFSTYRKKILSDDENSGPSNSEPGTVDVNFSNFTKNTIKMSDTLPNMRIFGKNTIDTIGTLRKHDTTMTTESEEETTTTMTTTTARDVKRPINAKNYIAERWNCGTCTFLNSRDREICEMCGKSRRKGNEDKPLASGGKECPQCTLVNEKNAANCEACASSLKDSPTYI